MEEERIKRAKTKGEYRLDNRTNRFREDEVTEGLKKLNLEERKEAYEKRLGELEEITLPPTPKVIQLIRKYEGLSSKEILTICSKMRGQEVMDWLFSLDKVSVLYATVQYTLDANDMLFRQWLLEDYHDLQGEKDNMVSRIDFMFNVYFSFKKRPWRLMYYWYSKMFKDYYLCCINRFNANLATKQIGYPSIIAKFHDMYTVKLESMLVDKIISTNYVSMEKFIVVHGSSLYQFVHGAEPYTLLYNVRQNVASQILDKRNIPNFEFGKYTNTLKPHPFWALVQKLEFKKVKFVKGDGYVEFLKSDTNVSWGSINFPNFDSFKNQLAMEYNALKKIVREVNQPYEYSQLIQFGLLLQGFTIEK